MASGRAPRRALALASSRAERPPCRRSPSTPRSSRLSRSARGVRVMARAQLSNPIKGHEDEPWYRAISPDTTEADVFACAHTIIDFYELIGLQMAADEPGKEGAHVNLSPAELERMRASTGSSSLRATTEHASTSLAPDAPDAKPTRTPDAKPSSSAAADAIIAKRARDEPADGDGARAKHARGDAPASAPAHTLANTPPRGDGNVAPSKPASAVLQRERVPAAGAPAP